MRQPIGRVLATALLAPVLGVLVLTGVAPAPATAATGAAAEGPVPADCEALDLGDRDQVVSRARLADQIVVGRVVATKSSSPQGGVGQGMRIVEYAVVVDDVIQGVLTQGTGVRVLVGWPRGEQVSVLQEAQTYLFFIRNQGDQLLADRCQGSQLLPDGLGEGQREMLVEFLDPDSAPTAVELTTPDDGAGSPPRLTRVIAPGAALSLIGVLGLVVVIRLSRGRAA